MAQGFPFDPPWPGEAELSLSWALQDGDGRFQGRRGLPLAMSVPVQGLSVQPPRGSG